MTEERENGGIGAEKLKKQSAPRAAIKLNSLARIYSAALEIGFQPAACSIGTMSLSVGLGLGKTDDLLVGFELPTLLEQFYAFKTLQYVAFCGDRAGSFETAML